MATVAGEHSLPILVALANLHRAGSLSLMGETAEGLAQARQAFADLAVIGPRSGQTRRLLALANCCERAGELDEALELLHSAWDETNTTGEKYVEAELHRCKGEWLFAHGRAGQAEAEDCYQRALLIARGQRAKLFELHAATSLAHLWRDQGKRTEACEVLAPIYDWFTEGFDAPVLKKAKALLEELA